MRYLLFLLCLLSYFGPLHSQMEQNPFELKDRLSATANEERPAATTTGNPFDLQPGAGIALEASSAPATAPSKNIEPGTPSSALRTPTGPLVIQSADPNQGKGTVLLIQLLLLLTLAGLWLLFGDLLRQVLLGTVNDALMTQVYTRRSGGELGALWACYVFSFLSMGFFLYLLTSYFERSIGFGIWGSWLTYSLVIAAILGLKNFVLVLFARLFPLRKEISRYMFTLMVFSILAGLFISPLNLLVSYAPEEWRSTFIYAGIGLLALVYTLHLFRGLLIANKLVTSRPVHLLLYICAVETAPIFMLYRFVSDSIA
ncbi:DUF4271 domain-containing protein [Neolewinella persica]|uniref:DUF4271 domain-containing protein n=1 Tax=Neolewinella persica TaxID=70998 RepID=UPI0003A851CA|nr:DUF4271 domain-containing protein [Neolewinella persica]